MKEKKGKVYQLWQAIYGLEQSLQAWFPMFSTAFGEFSFYPSALDHSTFDTNTEKLTTILIVWVDVILLTKDNMSDTERVKVHLAKVFDIKNIEN